MLLNLISSKVGIFSYFHPTKPQHDCQQEYSLNCVKSALNTSVCTVLQDRAGVEGLASRHPLDLAPLRYSVDFRIPLQLCGWDVDTDRQGYVRLCYNWVIEVDHDGV